MVWEAEPIIAVAMGVWIVVLILLLIFLPKRKR